MAGTCAFISAAFITQFYYTQYNESHIANSIIALLSEYSVYIPIFSLLFYWDNRHRYINPLTGKKDYKVITKNPIIDYVRLPFSTQSLRVLVRGFIIKEIDQVESTSHTQIRTSF